MKKTYLITIFLCLFVSHRAIAADWPQFLGDNDHTAKSSETLEPPLSVQWSFSGEDKFISTASVKDGKVFIGSRDKSLYAISEADGTQIWKYTALEWIDSTPFVADGKVTFSSKDGHVYCVNTENGALLWKFETGGTSSSSPIVDEGVVFVGAGFPEKKVYALNAETGSELWSVETDQMVYSSAAVSGDNIYIGSNDGKIYSLKKSSGEINWTFKTNGGIYYASPAVFGDKVFLASGDFDWAIYAVNIDDGKLAWSYTPAEAQPTPTYVSSVAVSDGDVYVVSGYGVQYLYSLNANTGTLKWKAQLDAATRFGFSSTPVVTDSTVYVATSSGKLRSFDVATGAATWEHDLGAQVLSSPVIANGTLFVATFDGTLYAFDGS